MRMSPQRCTGERGAVLVVVAAFTIVAVIFLAFVVDIGNQRQDRRQLTTSTDAAALDVAKRWADNSLEPLTDFNLISAGRYDCSVSAQEYLGRNREIDAAYECEAEFLNGQLASVRVFSAGTTEYQVGSAIGIDEGSVNSTTSVRVTSTTGGGLRPFAVCSRDPDVLAWYSAAVLAVATNNPVPQDTITVGGPKFLPPQCEQNNANWGFVQFQAQDNGVGTTGQNALAGTIVRGTTDPLSSYDNGDLDYDEERQVCIDDNADGTFYDDQDPVTCVTNANGAGGWNNANTAKAFDELIALGTTFHLPLYAEIEDLGGQRTGFPIIAFAEVKLIGYNASGANGNSVTLRFLNLSSGDCCDVNDGNQQLEICDVGTTSGDILSSFANACQTSQGSSVPPPPLPPAPPPCTVLDVAPPNQSMTVSNPGGVATSAAQWTITVDSGVDCLGLAVDLVRNNSVVAAAVAGPLNEEFTASVPIGATGFQKNQTYTVRVSHEGQVLEESATLSTN